MPAFMEFRSKVSAQELSILFDLNKVLSKYNVVTSIIKEKIAIILSYTASGIMVTYPSAYNVSNKDMITNANIRPMTRIRFFPRVCIKLDAM
ncbi:MAG TPA: hypothetical protein VKA98_07755 [Nitrososphaeraceae archaeon]|nr:hypothetical protein [Nitrososphaeraceae archaeon]